MQSGNRQRAIFGPGQRVRISLTYHWAQGARGTIASAPGWPRTVEARKGPIWFYWVRFDEAQRDPDGDGPYLSAEIDAQYLESID